MDEYKVTEPKQKRSMEKKQKITDAGFRLFCEKGYYNTNTAEIAKEAGVSTGIIYRYFPDKKAIFFSAFESYLDDYYNALFSQLNELTLPIDIRELLLVTIELFTNQKAIPKSAHEELNAVAHSDSEVADFFARLEESLTTRITQLLPALGLTTDHPHEKLHLIFSVIENYCHKLLYSEEDCIDYTYYKNLVIEICLNIFDYKQEN